LECNIKACAQKRKAFCKICLFLNISGIAIDGALRLNYLKEFCMMRYAFIYAVVLGLFSCSAAGDRVSEMTTLLVSTEWKVPEQDKLMGVWSFKPDGTYIEDFNKDENKHKILLKGKWEWITENEITITYKSMSINGADHLLNDKEESDFYILRVTELTKENLKVIKRFNGDSEDSGFAKEVNYIATKLKN